MRTRPVIGLSLGVAVVVVLAIVAVFAFSGDGKRSGPGGRLSGSTNRPAPTCDRYTGPNGDDDADGTADHPFRTLKHLSDALRPGQTGCLLAGDYAEGEVQITNGGAAGQPITLTAADPTSLRPLVSGRIVVEDSANNVIISGLALNGRNEDKLPSPTINGDNVVLLDNDITSENFGICINLGSESFGIAVGTVIQDNRIHNCGEYPVTNLEHGIYVNYARDTTITGNLIYDNADRGIQLYPDAQNTRITNNVIDGNGTGVIFSGTDGQVSSNNYVGRNVISDSVRYNVDAYWGEDPGPVGQGNVVEDNCLWGAGMENVSDQTGFAASFNLTADPMYVDRASGNYALQAGSPCAGRIPNWLDS